MVMMPVNDPPAGTVPTTGIDAAGEGGAAVAAAGQMPQVPKTRARAIPGMATRADRRMLLNISRSFCAFIAPPFDDSRWLPRREERFVGGIDCLLANPAA